jgi:hypothetical protein
MSSNEPTADNLVVGDPVPTKSLENGSDSNGRPSWWARWRKRVIVVPTALAGLAGLVLAAHDVITNSQQLRDDFCHVFNWYSFCTIQPSDILLNIIRSAYDEHPKFALENQDFYQGILIPISLQTMSVYLNRGISRQVMFTLFISQISFALETGQLVPPVSDEYNTVNGYQGFSTALQRLIDRGLTVELEEPVEHIGPPLSQNDAVQILRDFASLDRQGIEMEHFYRELPPAEKRRFTKDDVYYQLLKKSISYRFCFDQRSQRSDPPLAISSSLSPAPPGSLSRVENEIIDGSDPAALCGVGLHSESRSALIPTNKLRTGRGTILLTRRSALGIIDYLGEIARHQLGISDRGQVGRNQGMQEPNRRIENYERLAAAGILFKIEKGKGKALSTNASYDGTNYHISFDPTRRDKSAEVVELVTELLALNSPTNPRAPSEK